jgi:hypothetical protein
MVFAVGSALRLYHENPLELSMAERELRVGSQLTSTNELRRDGNKIVGSLSENLTESTEVHSWELTRVQHGQL